MARSQQSFSKQEKEKKKAQKRKQKQEKKEERKAQAKSGDLDSMMAYVDEFGNITDTPPDPNKKKEVIKASDIEIGVPRTEKDEDDDGVKKGRVAFFNDSKGFGFINEEGSQERYFVHVSGLKEPIQEGNRVSFKLIKGDRGLNAVEVELI